MINKSYASGAAANNFAFNVSIFNTDGETLDLELPIDKITGLNDGTTSVIRSRNNTFGGTTLKPHCGLTTASDITMEGTQLYNLDDSKKIQYWRKQCRQEVSMDIDAEYRTIVIQPTIFDDYNVEVPNSSGNQPGKIFLYNCVAVELDMSDFDVSSQSILTYTIKIAFERMEIL